MNGKRRRIPYCFTALLLLCLGLALLNLAAGSTHFTMRELFAALFPAGEETMASRVIWSIRIPRLLAAALLGGSLSVSGFLLQTFFANPIAGPFVLGVSSGAKLTVALTMIFCLGRGILLSAAGMVAAAFVGSLFAMGFVLLAAGRLRGMSVSFADDANIVNLHYWSMGSFSGIGWGELRTAAVTIGAAGTGAFFLSKPMAAYQLGEAYAGSMGVNIRRFRAELILLSSILSACVTAFAGPISFVGIAVPQLMKSMLRTAKPILMIPACFLGGAGFCLLCDLIARTLFAPTELSISSVTAVFGAPIVIWMLLTRRRGASS